MKWFKCPNLNSALMLEVEEQLGGLGVYQILKVINEAQEQNDFNFDALKVKKWASVKIDRAKKLLPFLQKIYSKTQKISENLPEISENLIDFNASNPHGSTRIKNRIEENRIDKKPPISPKGDWVGFDEFWENYPRKVSKQAALKAWNKLKPSHELLATIQQALTSQSGSEQWRKDNGVYIPHAATWLNGKRWNDVLQTPNSPLKPQSLTGKLTDPDHKSRSQYWRFTASDGRTIIIHANHLRRMNQHTLEVMDKAFPGGLETEYDIRETEFMPSNPPDSG